MGRLTIHRTIKGKDSPVLHQFEVASIIMYMEKYPEEWKRFEQIVAEAKEVLKEPKQ